MNKQRRKELNEIISKLENLRDDLECLQGEEQDYYDNMPENLQCSERGERAEEAVSSLEDALYNIDALTQYPDRRSRICLLERWSNE